MNMIYLLVPLSIVLLFCAIALFFWAVKNQQFDDLDSPATRVIINDKHR